MSSFTSEGVHGFFFGFFLAESYFQVDNFFLYRCRRRTLSLTNGPVRTRRHNRLQAVMM